jgi:hypothetical protein
LTTLFGIHHGFACDKSGMCPIVGTRYTLIGSDPSYDLCEAEFSKLSPADQAMYSSFEGVQDSWLASLMSLATNAAVDVVGKDADDRTVFAAEMDAFGPTMLLPNRADPCHWWFASAFVAKAAEYAAARPLPRWRTVRREPETLESGTGESRHIMLMPRPGDFIDPCYRAYAVWLWEYQPGWGTTAPPPTQSDRSTWRGLHTWTDAQDMWFKLFDDCDGDLPAGSERRTAWQNALKRYARDAIAWEAAGGGVAANAQMDAEAERGAKRRRSAEEQRMARFDSTLLEQQKVWAQDVAHFAALCRGPHDAVPEDELHLIICRDSSAVLELHSFIESHPPTGALNWGQTVNDCAFDAWRKIEPLLKGEDESPAKSWDEMMAAGFRLLVALPSAPTSLQLPAHADRSLPVSFGSLPVPFVL